MIRRMTAAVAATMIMLAACSKAPEPAPPAAPAAAEPVAAPAPPARTASPAGAQVFIVSPKDGATVANPVKVVFGITGMTLAPAGTPVANAGHHHLLIDTDLPADLSLPLPADETHVHFGKAQTETEATLAPGKHTLQLVLGDHVHVPFDPVVSSPKITITVK